MVALSLFCLFSFFERDVVVSFFIYFVVLVVVVVEA